MVQGSSYFVSKPSGFRIGNYDHMWIKRAPSESIVNVELEAPSRYVQSHKLLIAGFSGFEMWD